MTISPSFILSAVLLFSVLTGCTTVHVRTVDSLRHPISHVCIQSNPRVLVPDVLQVIERGFLKHNISTRVISGFTKAECEYVLTYSALRSWDIVPYIAYAELRLARNGQTVGIATYEHSGWFGLNKWMGTEAKLAPLMDSLLTDLQESYERPQ